MGDLKEETICIRISPEEKAKIEAAAEAHHLKLSQFVRMLVLSTIEKDNH